MALSPEKVDEIVQDALDEERLAEIERTTVRDGDDCPGSFNIVTGEIEHCGDCTARTEDGEPLDECVHCPECCICTTCSYARIG